MLRLGGITGALIRGRGSLGFSEIEINGTKYSIIETTMHDAARKAKEINEESF